MIIELAKEPYFAVTPHVSMRKYKETILNVAEIANSLDVEFIVEGVAMKYDENIRFSVQLIDVKLNECIWAETYDCTSDNRSETQADAVRFLKNNITCVFADNY